MRKFMALVLSAILFLDVVSLGVIFFTDARDIPDEKEVEESSADSTIFAKATVVAVGNNMLHKEILDQAHAGSTTGGYDFSYIYEKIKPVISQADAAVFTQESVVSSKHAVSGTSLFNAPAELGDEMRKVGFNVVDIATNHSLDYGEEGLLDTIEYWESKDMLTVGAYATKSGAEQLTMQNVNGVRIAWVGFTESTNDHSLPDDSPAVLNKASDETRLMNLIDLASRKADCVIVCAHWGNEYETQVTGKQKELAAKMADWGANVIIGSHPHVLQEAEFITNRNGQKTFVAYSLGNFISAQAKGELMLGGLLSFDIVRNTETGESVFENFNISGVVTHYGYNMSRIRVYPLSEYDDEVADVHGVKEKTPEFSVKYLNNMLSSIIDKQFLK